MFIAYKTNIFLKIIFLYKFILLLNDEEVDYKQGESSKELE